MVLTRPFLVGHRSHKLALVLVAQQKNRVWLLCGIVTALLALKFTKKFRHRVLAAMWNIISRALEVRLSFLSHNVQVFQRFGRSGLNFCNKCASSTTVVVVLLLSCPGWRLATARHRTREVGSPSSSFTCGHTILTCHLKRVTLTQNLDKFVQWIVVVEVGM
jgi:hypothetical protein